MLLSLAATTLLYAAIVVARADAGALHLTLEVWHPNCWVLATTRAVDVGLLSYG